MNEISSLSGKPKLPPKPVLRNVLRPVGNTSQADISIKSKHSHLKETSLNNGKFDDDFGAEKGFFLSSTEKFSTDSNVADNSVVKKAVDKPPLLPKPYPRGVKKCSANHDSIFEINSINLGTIIKETSQSSTFTGDSQPKKHFITESINSTNSYQQAGSDDTEQLLPSGGSEEHTTKYHLLVNRADSNRSKIHQSTFYDGADQNKTYTCLLIEQTSDRLPSTVEDSKLNDDSAAIIINSLYSSGSYEYIDSNCNGVDKEVLLEVEPVAPLSSVEDLSSIIATDHGLNLLTLSSSSSSGSDNSFLSKNGNKYDTYSMRSDQLLRSSSDCSNSLASDQHSLIADSDFSITDDNTSKVSRRIKSWFSSFGKGGIAAGAANSANNGNSQLQRDNSIRRKKRASTFYLNPQEIPTGNLISFDDVTTSSNTMNSVWSQSATDANIADDSSNVSNSLTNTNSFYSDDHSHNDNDSNNNNNNNNNSNNNNNNNNHDDGNDNKSNDNDGQLKVNSVSIDKANSELFVTDDQQIEEDDEEEKELNRIKMSISDKRKRKAFLIVRELISSEKVLIDVLKLLVRDFKEFIFNFDAAATDSPVLSQSDFDRMSNYLPQLLSFNEDLLQDLQERIHNWLAHPKIADIIVRKGPFLKLYSTYIQNFEKHCNLLDEFCHKYPRFANALKQFEMLERCKKLSIKHYMLKPVQRIPQYRLLLQDYLDQLDESSIDYNDTVTALRIVCDVADHANRCIELDVHLNRLLELQSQLGNYEIIRPGRQFIKAGELYKLSRKGLQLRYFILLNDCLLYTNYNGSTSSLKVNYELPLTGMKISIPQVEDYHNEFSIITITRSFTIVAKSANEREKWVNTLHETIKEHNKRQLSFVGHQLLIDGLLPQPLNLGKEAPVWIPDHRVTMCQLCTAEFKVTFRRHHCRACGKVVCGPCSDNKAPLQYMNFQAARVCDECYQYLLKEFEESSDAIVKSHFGSLDDDMNVLVSKNIRVSFKKHESDPSRKLRKHIPMRLKEVTANDSGSKMSGWLYKRSKRTWKKYWFVLKEQVLYIYKASEDVKALETVPVLGYTVETFSLVSDTYEDVDSKCVFQLAHVNQEPVVFRAENESIANKWVLALHEAVNLS